MNPRGNLFKRSPALVPVVAVLAGFLLGVLYAWVLNPPDFVDATPAHLRADLQEDYLRMAIDSFLVNQSTDLAVRRWQNLEADAVPAYTNIQHSPQGANPQVIVAFGERVKAVLGSPPVTEVDAPAGGLAALVKPAIAVGGVLALAVIVLAGIFITRRRRPRRVPVAIEPEARPAPPPPAPLVEASPAKANTNFEKLGLAPPITQTMTTYMLGDDLYDESFSIDTPGGEFLGEYGVGISESIGVGEPKKVAALEIWLFDKNDINTATKVIMSAHAHSDQAIRDRLERKGDLILIAPQQQVLLETKTLQLLATVTDLEYGSGAMPKDSYFERVTLELAVWPK